MQPRTTIPVSLFGLSETWLYNDISNDEIAIPGYHVFRKDRQNKDYKQRDGGPLLYIEEDYDICKVNTDQISTTEILHVSISRQHVKSIHIILIHKPRTITSKSLISTLQNALKYININKCYFIGDFNIDMAKTSSSSAELRRFIQGNHFNQLIKMPTRVTEHTETLIDCIFTNRTDLNNENGIIEFGISDHNAIYTCRKHKNPT